MVAVIAAGVMAHSRLFERTVYPIALLIKVTPIVAIAPLFVIWFGFGSFPKMMIAALITFFPVMVNTFIGLRSVNPTTLDFFRLLDAKRCSRSSFKLRSSRRAPVRLRRVSHCRAALRHRRRSGGVVHRRPWTGQRHHRGPPQHRHAHPLLRHRHPRLHRPRSDRNHGAHREAVSSSGTTRSSQALPCSVLFRNFAQTNQPTRVSPLPFAGEG